MTFQTEILLQKAIRAYRMRDWSAAEDSLEALLAIEPEHPKGNLFMARLAWMADCFEEARVFAEKALSGKQEHKDARQMVIRCLLIEAKRAYKEHRFATVIDLCEKALAMDEHDAEAVVGLASSWSKIGFPEKTRELFQRRLTKFPDNALVFSQWIVLLAGKDDLSAEKYAEWSREWDRRFGQPNAKRYAKPNRCKPVQEKNRIRIGFLSTTFREHAVCCFFLPLLKNLDRERFSLHAFHDNQYEDKVTDRIRESVEDFQSTHGLSPIEAAAKIRESDLDILVDLNGFFDKGRQPILVERPAPIQVHYLGGAGPTGIQALDWWIADELTDPEETSPGNIPERVHRLPGGIHAYAPLTPLKDPIPPPSVLSGQITFGSCQHLMKMENNVLEVWGRVLEASPGSRLLLIKDVFADSAVRKRFRNRAIAAGIDPTRLVLRGLEKEESFANGSVYQAIDIALDIFPYNGVTSTCESLMMGVPVVTLRGKRFLAREAAAILERVGRREWIAETKDEYVAIATRLAKTPEALPTIRQQLRGEFLNSPVADGPRVAREMMEFFELAVRG